MHEILFPVGILWSEEREKNEGCRYYRPITMFMEVGNKIKEESEGEIRDKGILKDRVRNAGYY